MRRLKPKSLIPGIKNISLIVNSHSVPDHLHQKAFDNSFLANIISNVSTGKIISVNRAAEKLLGYSGVELLSKNFDEIFTPSDAHFKRILRQREAAGHAMGDVTVTKKNGRKLPCQITSVVFTGDNQIQKSITTLVDRSQGIRRQTGIDRKREKAVADEIINALSQSDATLKRLHNLEHKLDEEITAKEESVSASLVQSKLFEKEWKSEIKLKAIQIETALTEAKKMVRSDLGKELHDNVNQLLAASRIYMDLALRNKVNRNDYINRSSEYTLTAIEEIRKLAGGLVNDTINNVGLCNAIGNLIHDFMQAYSIKIRCQLSEDLPILMSSKFKLDVFRIVQEQLNNIIKHARASSVDISLSQNKAEIILSIADDGIGFDTSLNVEGIGIMNIKSRAVFYEGTADFISKPGKGCVLKAVFPIENATMESL
ncbi:MAG: PAS domain-containing protein [Bacteroidota bacterium]|nr:PAS domain-containing protein [Bacteroidota bacterium]